jgi:hypothetical protein
MTIDADRLDRQVQGISLIAAPLLLSVATFFWNPHGEIGLTGGAMQVLAFVLFIPGFVGLYGLLRRDLPGLAVFGCFIAFWGCVAGAGFGYDGIFEAVVNTRSADLAWSEVRAEMGGVLPLTLLTPGLVFPAALFVAAVALARVRAIPRWAGILLACGAVAFPVGRVPRSVALAHVADALLFVSLASIGWMLLTGRAAAQRNE